MKITGFCPMVVTKEQDFCIETFEALGFEKRHTKTDIEGGKNVGVAMKDTDGNRIIIASTTKERADITAILINVDNFREAYDFFIGKGFIDPRENKTTVTGSDEATMLISPSGFPVVISEHFK